MYHKLEAKRVAAWKKRHPIRNLKQKIKMLFRRV
jgi:hypothetical protein